MSDISQPRQVWTPPPGAPIDNQTFEPYQPTPGLAPAPGGQWVAPPAAPKSNKWKKTLLIVGLVVGLPLIGVGACSYWVYGKFAGPTNEANRVVQLVQDQQYDDALGAIDPSCTGGIDEFIEQAKADPFDEFFFIVFEIAAGDVTESSVQGSIFFEQQGEVETRIELKPDGGDWKVCRIRLGVTGFQD